MIDEPSEFAVDTGAFSQGNHMFRLATLVVLGLLATVACAEAADLPRDCPPANFYTPPARPFYVPPGYPFYAPPGGVFYKPPCCLFYQPAGPFYTPPARPFYVPPGHPFYSPPRDCKPH